MRTRNYFLKYLTIFCVAFGFTTIVFAEDNTSKLPSVNNNQLSIAQRITGRLEPYIRNGKFVGVEAGIYQNSEVNYLSFGLASKGGLAPTPDTVYQINAVTNVFSSILFAETVIHNKVKLQDTIDDFLPQDVQLQTDSQDTITFQQILTHTAGFPEYLPNSIQSIRHFMHQYLPLWQADFKPGHNYKYSDVGFELLTVLTERIEKQSYTDLLKNEITSPLNMTATNTLTGLTGLPLPRAESYTKDGNAVPYLSYPWNKIGFLTSTASDLMKFLQANLGVINTPPELSQALELTHNNYYTIDSDEAMGLAWHIDKPSNVLWSNGGKNGFGAFIGFNPDAKIGIVLLASETQNPDDKTIKAINVLTILGRHLLANPSW